MSEDLKNKLDQMALAIIEQVSVGSAVPQEVLKALEVLKGISGWYSIRQKLSDGDEEGEGINGFKKELAASRDQRGSDLGGYVDEFGDLGDTSERKARGKRRGPIDIHRDDTDEGGPDLDRIMANLPRDTGRFSRALRRGGAKGDSAAGGGRIGGAGVAGDDEPKPNGSLGNGGV